MDKPIIRVEGLGKQYRIGARELKHKTIREALVDAVVSPFRRLNGNVRSAVEEVESHIWALKDVSLDVQRGEVLGIIGRNGAGKSTLLKILSRITEPTEGRIEVRGRVASLLEVGTGFHGELTGRENVYLNGTIMGMRKVEIDRKFDEIIAFAEVEKFVDTPVKRYSSGMYLRLAFAVAAHLDPEILVVDEVLAVGDADFQKKCLGRMREQGGRGRTVLFVSHNMVAVMQLCTRVIWLDVGKVRAIGEPNEITGLYLDSATTGQGERAIHRMIKGDGMVEFLSYRVLNKELQERPLPTTKEDLFIDVVVKAKERILHPAFGIEIYNSQSTLLTDINTREMGVSVSPLPKGESTLRIRLREVPYLPGNYTATIYAMNPQGHLYSFVENAIQFELRQSPLCGTTQLDHRWGCVFTAVEFTNLGMQNSL